jgi:hypothetical protein
MMAEAHDRGVSCITFTPTTKFKTNHLNQRAGSFFYPQREESEKVKVKSEK